MGPILVCCFWPGISLEGLATAASEIPRTRSANLADTLQEIQKNNKYLRKELKKAPWPSLKHFSARGRTYSLPLRAESREPSKRPAKARLEYLAGFFDRDGCVSYKTDLSGCTLLVSQSCDHAEVLMLFREAFGGSITRNRGGMGLVKPRLQWRAFGPSARRAAELLAPHSITKQPQLLLAERWPETESEREDCKAKLRALKDYDSAVAGPCSWEYFAGFFDANGCIHQPKGGASLQLKVEHKHPRVLRSLRDFLKTSGIDATLGKSQKRNVQRLWVTDLSNCKQILQQLSDAGLFCKAKQAQLALSLTPDTAAEVSAALAGFTTNKMFGKRLDAAGQERTRNIAAAQKQAASLRSQRRLDTEAEAKLREVQSHVARLKLEHELFKAREENQQLAYRYEGLRLSDTVQMLHHLQMKSGRAPGICL
ncbi:hypothetical protein AK812_SmicGene1774 [Symbiodinium microadriaticum]|uniref:Homing endonuclease LAGLIDADG domain-containing protein n=1 Tax=Symbiodinium microadriaticum TaxID=2951 RepID=A0A1Q9F395_SYMMI|nr:hypothetical protein AK812_SmicGene1774 [Symbiodinium microadriaticum]